MTFFLTEQTCALLCVIGPGVMQRSTSFVFIFLTRYNPLQHSQPTGTETGKWLKAAAPTGGGALGEAHQEGPHGPLTMPQRSPVTSPTGDRTLSYRSPLLRQSPLLTPHNCISRPPTILE